MKQALCGDVRNQLPAIALKKCYTKPVPHYNTFAGIWEFAQQQNGYLCSLCFKNHVLKDS